MNASQVSDVLAGVLLCVFLPAQKKCLASVRLLFQGASEESVFLVCEAASKACGFRASIDVEYSAVTNAPIKAARFLLPQSAGIAIEMST